MKSIVPVASRNRLILVGSLLGILFGSFLVYRLSGRPLILETARGRYRVLNSRYVHGTNLTFSVTSPGETWVRSQLAHLGVGRKTPRGHGGFGNNVGVHAIAILCKGRVPNEDLMQVDAECITDVGQIVRLNGRMTVPGPTHRVYFVFFFTDREMKTLHERGFTDSEVTNFSPSLIRLLRRSDRQELTRLPIPHQKSP